MIYILTNQENVVLTDSWFNYIPEVLSVYIDDVLLGEYINNSLANSYISITIPAEDIVNIPLKESKLKWFSNGVLLKEELVSIKSTNTFEISSINKSNILFYE
mgnify:CR=1 FL=1